MPASLDAYDRQLLALVQEDAGRTAEALTARVPLSVSAIQRRLKRLREEGVIEREVAVLDPGQVGGVTLFLASLRLAQERGERVSRLRAWLDARAEVQQAYYVTGDADFVVVVCAPDVAAKRGLAVPVAGQP